jgi:hypothetical protein
MWLALWFALPVSAWSAAISPFGCRPFRVEVTNGPIRNFQGIIGDHRLRQVPVADASLDRPRFAAEQFELHHTGQDLDVILSRQVSPVC